MGKQSKDSGNELPPMLQMRLKLMEQMEQENPEGYGDSLYYQALSRHVEREKLAMQGKPIPPELMEGYEQNEGEEYQIQLPMPPKTPG